MQQQTLIYWLLSASTTDCGIGFKADREGPRQHILASMCRDKNCSTASAFDDRNGAKCVIIELTPVAEPQPESLRAGEPGSQRAGALERSRVQANLTGSWSRCESTGTLGTVHVQYTTPWCASEAKALPDSSLAQVLSK